MCKNGQPISCFRLMPYIALNWKNEEVTASHCRDEYLRTGEVLADFRCAFCLCTYFARNIYTEGKIGRAPHFFVTKADAHKGACDGSPLGVVPEPVGNKQGKRIPDQDFLFPEKFVAKLRPRVVVLPTGSDKLAPTEEEIRSRRNRAGEEYGSTTFTSSVLQVIVESKNKITKWCFDEAKKQGLDKAAQEKLLKETADSYPLQLFDQKGLTYNSAFWSAHHERTKTDKRIFHAKSGKIGLSSSGFVIRSEPKGASQAGNGSKRPGPRPVELHYYGETYDSSTPPRAHSKALADLAAIAADETIQWYAYGEMTLDGDKLIIRLKTLDHLYFRKEAKFTPRTAS